MATAQVVVMGCGWEDGREGGKERGRDMKEKSGKEGGRGGGEGGNEEKEGGREGGKGGKNEFLVQKKTIPTESTPRGMSSSYKTPHRDPPHQDHREVGQEEIVIV